MGTEITAERPPKKDTSAANAASQRTFARRRAERARRELESQGWTVIPPGPEADDAES